MVFNFPLVSFSVLFFWTPDFVYLSWKFKHIVTASTNLYYKKSLFWWWYTMRGTCFRNLLLLQPQSSTRNKTPRKRNNGPLLWEILFIRNAVLYLSKLMKDLFFTAEGYKNILLPCRDHLNRNTYESSILISKALLIIIIYRTIILCN